jgi:hypothetical protein
MRIPVFELHILPMIRAIDREHMRFAFDLWDYDQLVQHVVVSYGHASFSGTSPIAPR